METQGEVLNWEVGKSHASDSNYRFFFNLVISNFFFRLAKNELWDNCKISLRYIFFIAEQWKIRDSFRIKEKGEDKQININARFDIVQSPSQKVVLLH